MNGAGRDPWAVALTGEDRKTLAREDAARRQADAFGFPLSDAFGFPLPAAFPAADEFTAKPWEAGNDDRTA